MIELYLQEMGLNSSWADQIIPTTKMVAKKIYIATNKEVYRTSMNTDGFISTFINQCDELADGYRTAVPVSGDVCTECNLPTIDIHDLAYIGRGYPNTEMSQFKWTICTGCQCESETDIAGDFEASANNAIQGWI